MKVVHIKSKKHDVYIGRGSKWGNPYIIGKDGNRAEVIRLYEEWVVQQPHLMESLHELRGCTLGCYCAPKACHGDVLLKLTEAELTESVNHWLLNMPPAAAKNDLNTFVEKSITNHRSLQAFYAKAQQKIEGDKNG